MILCNMSSRRVLELLLLVLLVLVGVKAHDEEHESSESSLRHHLKETYDKYTRPGVYNEGKVTTVSLNPWITSVDVCQSSLLANINGWLILSWQDPRLHWDPTEYHGLTEMRVESHYLWTPDLLAYNSKPSMKLDWLEQTKAVVRHDGTVQHMPPFHVAVSCHFNTTQQYSDHTEPHLVCPLTIGSWAYTDHDVELELHDQLDLGHYEHSGHWAVTDAINHHVSEKYNCCNETFALSKIKLILDKRHMTNVAYFTTPEH